MEKKLYVFKDIINKNDCEVLSKLSDEEFKRRADFYLTLEEFQNTWNDPDRDYIMLNSDTTIIRFI